MLGLYDVNRNETNIGSGLGVTNGTAPKIEGWGTVLLPEAALGFPVFRQPPCAYGFISI
jgi:hypothetical protein